MKTDFVDFEDVAAERKLSSFGPYERAVDYYGDGSFYLVESPGHMPGHMAAAIRIAPNSFVFLAADTCHSRQCYSPGKRLISQAAHADISVARRTVQWLTRLNNDYKNVVIILAHEQERAEEMPLFPGSDLKEWTMGEIERRKRMG